MVPLDLMYSRGVRIAIINLQEGYVCFEDSTVAPINLMFDGEGNVVLDWEDAVACEFGNTALGYGVCEFIPHTISDTIH
jgi:hypothetical protein